MDEDIKKAVAADTEIDTADVDDSVGDDQVVPSQMDDAAEFVGPLPYEADGDYAQPVVDEPDPVKHQQQLRDEIERSSFMLEELEAELKAVESEYAAVAERGPQYEALAKLCGSLEALDVQGAANLFWGDDASGDETRERIRHAEGRIEEFENELAVLRGQRDSLAGRIGNQHLVLEHLDYSLSEVLEEEELRQAEWLIEREESDVPFKRRIVMPWNRGGEEDRRFHRSLAATAFATLVIGFAIPFVDLPIPEREQLIEVPERVARLVELNKPKPVEAPAPVAPEPEPEPDPVEPEDQPEELVAEEVVPELSEEPAAQVAEAPQPASTREQVQQKGILAFRESFAGRSQSRSRPRLGSQAQISSAGAEAVGRQTRSMVASSATESSGGINLAELSRDVGGGAGGGAIEGVQVTQVASTIGGNGSAERPLAGGPSAGRTDEEIQIVFDRYKASLYRLYNRELRKDPTLRGQVVLRLTIEPDGTVSFCQLESSDMDAPTLADQIVTRVSGFDFGAKEDILAVTIVYPIDFLPAA